MRCRKEIPYWMVPVLLLMLVSSVPRFGCLCVDGTRLPYCQKIVDDAIRGFHKLFSSGAREGVCHCCGACTEDAQVPSHDCNGSTDPCDCRVTLDGPQWAESDRIEFTPAIDQLLGFCDWKRVDSTTDRCVFGSTLMDHARPIVGPMAGTMRLNV